MSLGLRLVAISGIDFVLSLEVCVDGAFVGGISSVVDLGSLPFLWEITLQES